MVAVSFDGSEFGLVTSDGSLSAFGSDALIFLGSTDQATVVEVQLPTALLARSVRIYPVGYHGHMCLRWDVNTCGLPSSELNTTKHLSYLAFA